MKIKSFKNVKVFLFAFALMAIAVSCKDDKDKDPQPGGGKNSVEGSWRISAITVDPAQNGITDYLAFLEALMGNDCMSRITFIFKADGTIAGNVPAGCQVDEDDVPGAKDGGRWKVNGNKIELTSDGETESYDLETSANEMRWSQNVSEDGENYKMTLVFKRQ